VFGLDFNGVPVLGVPGLLQLLHDPGGVLFVLQLPGGTSVSTPSDKSHFMAATANSSSPMMGLHHDFAFAHPPALKIQIVFNRTSADRLLNKVASEIPAASFHGQEAHSSAQYSLELAVSGLHDWTSLSRGDSAFRPLCTFGDSPFASLKHFVCIKLNIIV
jgi:hypothetical protein